MTSDLSSKLKQLFNEQIETSNKFLGLLLQERQAIAANQIDRFNQITQEKMPVIEALSRLDIEIFTLLGQSCPDNDPGSVEKFLLGLAEELLPLWKALLETARKCQAENQLNSRIVESSRLQNERLLDILLGRTSNVELYGASGQKIKDRNGACIKA